MGTRGLLTKNFGGIDAKASRLNISDNEAENIVNFDIGIDGSITQRLGSVQVSGALGTPFNHLGRFFDGTGAEYFVAIAGGKVYRSADSCVTWTDVTGALTADSSAAYIGVGWRNRYLVANGTNPPFYVPVTGNADTLKNASLLQPPIPINRVDSTGTDASVNYPTYYVTANTARGETLAFVGIVGGAANIEPPNTTGAVFNTIYWTPVPGATSYNIYVSDSINWAPTPNGKTAAGVAGGVPVLRDIVDGSASSYNDTLGNLCRGNAENNYIYYQGYLLPGAWPNTAFRTPSDWESNGYPEGFAVIARGREERLLAWRKDTIWASALRNPNDWLYPNDAFNWVIISASDARVTGIANLFDYTVVFTRSDALVYTGGGGGTMTLQKQVPIGLQSHYSIQTVGDDFYFWSQHGPTSFRRIMSGADIQSTTNFNRNVQPLVQTSTNQAQWSKMVVYNDPLNNRVVWWVPGAGQTSNNYALVYQYDVNAWTSYSGWTPISVVRSGNGTLYAGFSDGYVYKIHSGMNDNGAPITATYTTGNMDIASWPPIKRIPFVDVLMDRGLGSYAVDFTWNMDAGRQTGDTVTLTQATTSGAPITISGPNMNYHRIHTFGIGNTCQLTFTAKTVNLRAKILGWATEVAAKGRRV